MNPRSVLFLSQRYLWRRREGGLASNVLAAVGIAVGVITMNVVLGVMNGFQMGFMETLLEVSSAHLRIHPAPGRELSAEVQWKILQDSRIRALYPVLDTQSLIIGPYGVSRGAFLRGVPPTLIFDDPSLARRLELVEGSWDLQRGDKIVLGSELARNLLVRVGDRVSLLALGGEDFGLLRPWETSFLVTGIFRTGFYDIDLGWGFVSLDQARDLFDSGGDLLYLIKLTEPFVDVEVRRHVVAAVEGEGAEVVSWREYNRSFFGALRMEKVIMMVLIALIFPVVWMGIQHGLRRVIRERQEDLGILKALGAGLRPIRVVFLVEGAVIGLLGAVWGTLVGLAILVNINALILGLERAAQNFLVHLGRWLGWGVLPPQSWIFGGVFYLQEIPFRVLWHEVLFAFLLAVASAAGSAWRVSGELIALRTREVLRNE